MKIRALVSFSGSISMAAGQVIDCKRQDVVNDLVAAGYVELMEKETDAPAGSDQEKETDAPAGSDQEKETDAPAGSDQMKEQASAAKKKTAKSAKTEKK